MVSILLSIALLATAVNAFTVPSSIPQSIHNINNRAQHRPSIITLNASKNKEKIASRTKWAEERGYSTAIDSSADSSSSGKAPKLIIAGAPASGKGTQCEIIKEKFGVVHLSTGDMLRAAVAAGTDVGKQAKDFMDAGKLVPDEVIIGVVSCVCIICIYNCVFQKGCSSYDTFCLQYIEIELVLPDFTIEMNW